MRSRSVVSCVVALLATGCSVGSNDPFMPANTGSASAGSSASTTAASGADGSATGDPSDTSGSTQGGPGTSGTTSGGSDPGTEGATSDASATSPSTTAGAESTGASGEGSESTGGRADACTGEALHPQLATPPLCEPTCTSIGFGNDCPIAEYCRLKDTETAVCESCVACGNLHAPCVTTEDCDIIFTCFMGQCTAHCDLDTPQTCGNPAACTDVGHPTHGVCNPNL